jgi:SulP family sulfate permease
MPRAPRIDLVLMLVVLLLTVFVDVITAVGVGVVLASLAFVKEAAELQVESIRTVSDPEHARLFSDAEATLFRDLRGRAMILHLSGLISFGAASEMMRRFFALGHYEVLIIDLIDVPRMDGSAALALDEIIERAQASEQQVLLVGLSYPVARLLGRMRVLDRVRDTHRFATRMEAVQAAAAILGIQREEHKPPV